MGLRKRIYLYFILTVQPTLAFCDTVWISRLFRPSDGLAYQIVRDIAQTPDGIVWFATWGGGVSRFDGSSWETYNDEQSVSDYMIRCLAFDRRGGLWVGTMEGIKYFDGRQWREYTTKNTPELKVNSVFSILPRANGEIWFGMIDGYLYSYDSNRTDAPRWRLVCDPNVFNNRSLRSTIEMEDDTIWIGGENIYNFDGKDWIEYPTDQRIYWMSKTPDGVIYAAGTKNVFQFIGQRWEPVEDAGSDPRSIACTKDGSILVGTKYGVRILQNGQWRDVTLSLEPSSPYVEAIQAFDDGSIWVGTRNGAYLIRQSDWSHFPPPAGNTQVNGDCFIASKQMYPKTITPGGQWWEWRKDKWNQLGDTGDAENQPIKIVECNNERILVQRERTIVEYNARDFSVIRSIPLPAVEFNKSVIRTANGSIVLHGHQDDWLYTWSGTAWQPFEEVPTHKIDEVQLFKETSDGNRWIAFKDAVVSLGKPYNHLEVFSSPRFRGHLVTDIVTDRNGRVWFGSSGAGIFALDETGMTNYTTRNGLPNDWILCLFESSDGTLWAGMDDSTIASYRDGRWIQFSYNDFQLDGRVTAISEDPSGAIWFALEPNGFVRYTRSSSPPDTSIDVSPNLVVPHGMGIFSFHGWDTWHTTPANELVYSWRLVHARNGQQIVPWTAYSSADTVSTPSLDPGNYRFEVRAADKERNVDLIPAQKSFTVEPHFFNRPGFLAVVYVALILVLFLAVRWYLAHRQLVSLAQIDKLTDVYKRDYFTILFEMEVKRAKRYNRDLSVLLLDIDQFKSINDTYGHDVGDEVLHAVAQRFRGQIRDIDLLGRWGGDEFIFLLPETDIDEAKTIAERICSAIQKLSIPTRYGEMNCTVSIGAVHLRDSMDTVDTLLKSADIALYRAKERGRNRIEVS